MSEHCRSVLTREAIEMLNLECGGTLRAFTPSWRSYCVQPSNRPSNSLRLRPALGTGVRHHRDAQSA
eukprot:6316215-Amphidinium_carterae.1